MAVSVKDLRYRTREVLKSLGRGEKPLITHRGHPVARLVPVTPLEKKAFKAIGFGMWKERSDMVDVAQWLDEQRRPRIDR